MTFSKLEGKKNDHFRCQILRRWKKQQKACKFMKSSSKLKQYRIGRDPLLMVTFYIWCLGNVFSIHIQYFADGKKVTSAKSISLDANKIIFGIEKVPCRCHHFGMGRSPKLFPTFSFLLTFFLRFFPQKKKKV